MPKARVTFSDQAERKPHKKNKNKKLIPEALIENDLPLEEEMIQRVNLSPEEINKIRSYEEEQRKLVEEIEGVR